MQITGFGKNLLASFVGAAILFVGGRALSPTIGQRLFPASWPQIAEWLHELGWLACLIVGALWFALRRSAPVPIIEVVTNYPVVIPAAGKATLIEWRDKNLKGKGGRVDIVNGSIHLELWNSERKARTQRSRPVTFAH